MLDNTIHPQADNTEEILQALQQAEHKRLIDPKYLEESKKPYTIRAVGYVRVSSELQAKKDKVSLPQQRHEIKEFIEENGWKLIGFYEDAGESGKEVNGRKEFARMVQDAETDTFDVIVAWTTDRLARNAAEITKIREELRQKCVQVTSVNEPMELVDPRRVALENPGLKKLLAYFLDFKAEQDNVTRTKRFNLGKEGKAKKGKIPCKTPFGYKKHISYNNQSNNKVEKDGIVPEKAEIVREIFNLYTGKGWGMRKIAEHLNFEGIPAPNGGRWCYSTIKYILVNPTYAGFVRWGWRLAICKDSRTRLLSGHEGIIQKGEHEPIISLEQFQKVQERLKLRRKFLGRASSCKTKGLLVGIARCGRCGGTTYVTHFHHWWAYRREKKNRQKYKKTLAYLCSNYSSYGRSGCSNRYVMSKDKLENYVVKEITKLARSKKARQAFLEEMKINNIEETIKESENLKNILNDLESRRKRQKDAYERGILSLSEFAEDTRTYESEKERLNQKLEKIQYEVNRVRKASERSEKIEQALDNFDGIWKKAEDTEKKDLLKSILEKVVVNEDKIDIYFSRTLV